MKEDIFKLNTSTIVYPSEYDVEEQIARIVKLSNQQGTPFLPLDVGKVVGLYIAWDRLRKKEA